MANPQSTDPQEKHARLEELAKRVREELQREGVTVSQDAASKALRETMSALCAADCAVCTHALAF